MAETRTPIRALGAWDAATIVAGSMIGSGIFIVSADIARQVGSPGGLLLVWTISGLLTLAGALCYGELAAMMPRAGGQYVYLKEAWSPLWGFLYGWTFFLVIQTGTIAAVAVAFARFLGVLVPWVSPDRWIVPPVDLSRGYAVSLSTQQLAGILSIVLLTWMNSRGLQLGRVVQDFFTSAKTLALLVLIAVAFLFGWDGGAVSANLGDLWTPRGEVSIVPELPFLPSLTAGSGLLGLLVALAVAQVGSLFSSDAWNNATFLAEEVRDPKRSLPRALLGGTGAVVVLYLLANLAYLVVLPLPQIQAAPDDRVGTAALSAIFGGPGAAIMAAAIVVSTFGCNNGLILSGARVTWAMARDGMFFRPIAALNRARVPGRALALQGLWSAALILPRTRSVDPSGAPHYGNLYGNLLDYVMFPVLAFYVLTIAGLLVLRRRRPEAERPFTAPGYPWLPLLYIVSAGVIALTILLYRTRTTGPGLLLVLAGVPVYLVWKRRGNFKPPAAY